MDCIVLEWNGMQCNAMQCNVMLCYVCLSLSLYIYIYIYGPEARRAAERRGPGLHLGRQPLRAAGPSAGAQGGERQAA